MAAGITLCGSLSKWAVTLGAAMHEAGYREAGLRWHYIPFETEDLAGALQGMRALGIRGFGVSMPFKIDIIPLLDELSPIAAKIGAVNTVVNDDGKLIGHNTDCVGAARALAEETKIDGAKILLLGAGGAAKAVAHGLIERGAQLTICNRSGGKGVLLAKEVGADHMQWSLRNNTTGYAAVINATSLGMKDVDPGSPLEPAALRQGLVVMDIVYKPLDTALLSLARVIGAEPIDGGRMLLHQAACQFELYTGVEAPLEAMDAALLREIG